MPDFKTAAADLAARTGTNIEVPQTTTVERGPDGKGFVEKRVVTQKPMKLQEVLHEKRNLKGIIEFKLNEVSHLIERYEALSAAVPDDE